MKKFTVRYNDADAMSNSLKVNHECMIMIEGENIEIRDEYHSIHELYQHRMALNIALFNGWAKNRRDLELYFDIKRLPFNVVLPEVMKSKLHHDGTMFEGDYFIVMAITQFGQISYHYTLKHWDKFRIPEVERTPEWDGHSSMEVMERLMKL